MRIDSFSELPKDKRPPRDLWSKPARLEEFLDTIWDTKTTSSKEEYLEYNLEDVE